MLRTAENSKQAAALIAPAVLILSMYLVFRVAVKVFDRVLGYSPALLLFLLRVVADPGITLGDGPRTLIGRPAAGAGAMPGKAGAMPGKSG